MQDVEAKLNSATQQIATLNQAQDKFKGRELDLKEKEINLRFKTEDSKLAEKTTNDARLVGVKEQEVQLEREQLYMETNNAKEVKQF